MATVSASLAVAAALTLVILVGSFYSTRTQMKNHTPILTNFGTRYLYDPDSIYRDSI
jgi:hypothetical protein